MKIALLRVTILGTSGIYQDLTLNIRLGELV